MLQIHPAVQDEQAKEYHSKAASYISVHPATLLPLSKIGTLPLYYRYAGEGRPA